MTEYPGYTYCKWCREQYFDCAERQYRNLCSSDCEQKAIAWDKEHSYRGNLFEPEPWVRFFFPVFKKMIAALEIYPVPFDHAFSRGYHEVNVCQKFLVEYPLPIQSWTDDHESSLRSHVQAVAAGWTRPTDEATASRAAAVLLDESRRFLTSLSTDNSSFYPKRQFYRDRLKLWRKFFNFTDTSDETRRSIICKYSEFKAAVDELPYETYVSASFGSAIAIVLINLHRTANGWRIWCEPVDDERAAVQLLSFASMNGKSLWFIAAQASAAAHPIINFVWACDRNTAIEEFYLNPVGFETGIGPLTEADLPLIQVRCLDETTLNGSTHYWNDER